MLARLDRPRPHRQDVAARPRRMRRAIGAHAARQACLALGTRGVELRVERPGETFGLGARGMFAFWFIFVTSTG